MKWLDYRRVAVSKLKLPGEIAKRMKEPRVIALAESTDELGGEPMHAPTIDGKTNKLIAGRDRMAATLLRKRKHVWVHVGVDWTDAELLKAEVHENLHRRHDDKAALTRALVDKAEALIVGQASDNDDDAEPTAGRPKTTRTKARELIAEASGATPESVRKLDERATARESAGTGEARSGVVAPPVPALIESFGRPVPAATQVRVMIVIDALDAIDKAARAAQRALSELEQALGDERWNPSLAQRLRDVAHRVGAEARAARPAYLCPACVDFEDDSFCKLCGHERSITADQYAALPREQKGVVPAADDMEPAPFGTPEYHRALSAVHAADGPCSCASCVKVADFDASVVAAGLDAPSAAKRKIPPIKSGVTYTTDDNGDVVEQDAAVIDKHIARAAKAKAPSKRIKVELNGETMTIDELERRTNGGGVSGAP